MKALNTSEKVRDLDAVIPERIKDLRAFYKLPAVHFDKIMGFGVGTTRRLELGKQKVYTSHLVRISQAIDISLDYFYTNKNAPTFLENSKNPEITRLLSAYYSIEDKVNRRNVFELIETLASELVTNKTE